MSVSCMRMSITHSMLFGAVKATSPAYLPLILIVPVKSDSSGVLSMARNGVPHTAGCCTVVPK